MCILAREDVKGSKWNPIFSMKNKSLTEDEFGNKIKMFLERLLQNHTTTTWQDFKAEVQKQKSSLYAE